MARTARTNRKLVKTIALTALILVILYIITSGLPIFAFLAGLAESILILGLAAFCIWVFIKASK